MIIIPIIITEEEEKALNSLPSVSTSLEGGFFVSFFVCWLISSGVVFRLTGEFMVSAIIGCFAGLAMGLLVAMVA